MIVVVDRDRFTLEVWKPGPGDERAECVHRCRCAVGRQGFETPRGVYETGPRSRTPDWQAPGWAQPPLQPGHIYKFGEPDNPYEAGLISLHGQSVKGDIRSGYAIHGTKNEASIPGRASHGCIRVKAPHLRWLYKNLPDNTLVVIV